MIINVSYRGFAVMKVLNAFMPSFDTNIVCTRLEDAYAAIDNHIRNAKLKFSINFEFKSFITSN